MTLEEAIEHCKQKADELSICNKECSLEHKQLSIWLIDLKFITENSYEDFMRAMNNFTYNYILMALQARLAANPSLSSKEVANLVAHDVNCLLEELSLNYRYSVPKKV